MSQLTAIEPLLDKVFFTERFLQAEILLIVPPFIRLTNASLGVHILQACAEAKGHKVAIFYANAFLAKTIGLDLYNAITFSSDKRMLGDRVFGSAAYDIETFTPEFEQEYRQNPEVARLEGLREYTISYEALQHVSQQVRAFSQLIADKVVASQFDIVGCTSMFNQTAASVAFLNSIKSKQPAVTTIIGGANCAGEMAKGVASLSPHIDYVFSGESETSFVAFLQQLKLQQPPQQRIIQGERCDTLDQIPTSNFYDYYTQIDASEIEFDWTYVHMPYESSRGCWWGQKYQCTFCGVHELRYRMKSADRVIEELKQQLQHHRSNYVNFCDDIMPMQYFKTLLPRLQAELPNIRFFIDQKANLSFTKVKALADAGVYDILPGIETLSTKILKDIDKGVTARQNLQMMRYAKGCNLHLSWFFLHGIPGEALSCYQQMAELLPLLRHLCPPVNFQDIKLLRFGLYVAKPDAYGVKNLKPMPIYQQILPAHADIDSLAYYFEGDYPSMLTEAPDLLADMAQQVRLWRDAWYQTNLPPELSITRVSSTQYLLTDTRDQQTKRLFIDEKQAAAALVAQARQALPRDWPEQWVVDNQLATIIDDWLVPLATTTPELFEYFEDRYKLVRKHAVAQRIPIAETDTI